MCPHIKNKQRMSVKNVLCYSKLNVTEPWCNIFQTLLYLGKIWGGNVRWTLSLRKMTHICISLYLLHTKYINRLITLLKLQTSFLISPQRKRERARGRGRGRRRGRGRARGRGRGRARGRARGRERARGRGRAREICLWYKSIWN